MKRWSAVINHSRTSGRPPQTAEFDWYGDLQRYLAPESEVVQITIYRSWSSSRLLRNSASTEQRSEGPYPARGSTHAMAAGGVAL